MDQEMQELVEEEGNEEGNISAAERGRSGSSDHHDDGDELRLTVDEVVERYVGNLGLSQVLHVMVVSVAWMFDAQNTLVTIFSDAQPSGWECLDKKVCEGKDKGEGSPAVCGLPAGSWEWAGGKTSSTIAEWSLICDQKFLAAVPASLFFLGSLLGSAMYGRLADAYLGRKRTLFLSCILTFITAFCTSFSPNIWLYAFLRFANGFSRSGIGICCLVLSTEVVGRKWRGQVGQYGFFFFTAGFLSLPLIAFFTRTHWRNLYRIISLLPLLYALVFLPFVSESPRWLLVRGRKTEALCVLATFARFNGRQLPLHLTLLDPFGTKLENDNNTDRHRNTKSSESLWKTKWAAKRMVMVMVTGFGVGFVYYGVQLNVENLKFNLYLTVAINALMEIPAVFIGSILLGFTNRRLLFSTSAFTAGASCLLCIIFTKGSGSARGWAQLSIESVGFMAASLAFDIIYIYCVELFPTNVRNFSVSLLRQALMLGASVAPLLVVIGRLNPSMSFVVFGGLSFLSGVLSFWLKETRNSPLYETLKQQEEEEEKLSSATSRGDDHHNSSGLELGNNHEQFKNGSSSLQSS